MTGPYSAFLPDLARMIPKGQYTPRDAGCHSDSDNLPTLALRRMPTCGDEADPASVHISVETEI
jgi:hypothetical protein